MPNFARIVTLAYMRILERPPDPGGLENFNRLMNEGLTEAMMREALLRSPEFAERNPDRGRASRTTARASGRGRGKGTRRRKPR
jgi:hypothetical protein